MRVSWTTPDEDKRALAYDWIRKNHSLCDTRDISKDLDAVIEHTGMMISSPVHVAAHTVVDRIRGSLPEYNNRFVPERWTCLVACDSDGEIIEMDPRKLKYENP